LTDKLTAKESLKNISRKGRKLFSSVEELPHFPFSSFKNFRKAAEEGEVLINLSQEGAIQWAGGDLIIQPDPGTKRAYVICRAIGGGFPSGLALLAYSVYAGHWWFLLGLPLCAAAVFVLDPFISRMAGILYSGPLFITFCVFAWAICNGHQPWTVLTGCLLAIWLALKMRLDIINPAFRQKVFEEERYLCLTWQAGWLVVVVPEENTEYSINFQTTNGKTTPTEYMAETLAQYRAPIF
jgi:hypothetical protein